MLIIGARGFAKEVLQVFEDLGEINEIAFYDDINIYERPLVFRHFKILQSTADAVSFFSTHTNQFTIGIGNPALRKKMCDKFVALGGELASSISPYARIGKQEIHIGRGTNILANAIISNSVSIGNGCILYYNSTITHDCEVGDFVELSPGATLLGRCKIDSFTQVGANATILPDITVGAHCIIGAGAVVTKNVPAGSVVAGVPATVKRTIDFQ